MLTHRSTPSNLTASAVSTLGLIRSLQNEIARPGSPLARRCATIARHLERDPSNRALQSRAADLLCDLLDLADQLGASEAGDPELLCAEFDE